MLIEFNAIQFKHRTQDGSVRLAVGLDRDEAFDLVRRLITAIERDEKRRKKRKPWEIIETKWVSVIKIHGKKIDFRGKEKAIMECLVRADGKPVTYETLHNNGWDGSYDPDIIKDGIKNLNRTLKKMEVGIAVRIKNKTAQLLTRQGG